MYPTLAADLAALPELLASTLRLAERALAGLDERPAARPAGESTPAPLPTGGIGLAGALEVFAERWEPGFAGSAGPRHLGWVVGGTTPAGLAGDWLTSVFDQNVGSRLASAAPDLERETVGWLAELFGLGAGHTGAFVTGATMSNFVGLAIAREWLGERAGVSVARSGVGALGPVPVLSGTAHSSVYKGLSMLGIGRDSLRPVATLPGREAVDVAALATALAELAGRPAIVVANAGTVNSVDFDDLAAIAALRARYPFWLHVDAAFGGFAALAPEHAGLVGGIAEADSVCIDLHKWLNVPYDSAVQFSRRPDLQIRVFQNAAAYLGLPDQDNPAYVHLTPETSRRLRALAAWFALSAYGRDGHREIVERNVASARLLGDRLVADGRWRLLAPVRLNVVCFTTADEPTSALVDAIVRAVAEAGDAFVTPTVYDGVPGLRAAFSNWRTTAGDVDRVVAALAAGLDGVLHKVDGASGLCRE